MSISTNSHVLKSLLLVAGLLFSITYCNAQSAEDSVNKALDVIAALPEVQSYFHVADSLYHGTAAKAQIMVVSMPTDDDPYFWVQAGIYSGERMTPEYNFYVYPKKWEVRFFDTMKDRVISLAEWRKRK